MSKILKALFVGVSLIAGSANATVIVTPKMLVHSHTKTSNASEDKWFTSCKFAESNVLPDGFGCDVDGKVISVEDFANRGKLNTSRLEIYKHKNVVTDEMRVIIEEIH